MLVCAQHRCIAYLYKGVVRVCLRRTHLFIHTLSCESGSIGSSVPHPIHTLCNLNTRIVWEPALRPLQIKTLVSFRLVVQDVIPHPAKCVVIASSFILALGYKLETSAEANWAIAFSDTRVICLVLISRDCVWIRLKVSSWAEDSIQESPFNFFPNCWVSIHCQGEVYTLAWSRGNKKGVD